MVPGEDPIVTGRKLNELIDRGFVFSGELLASGERVQVRAFREEVQENVVSVVIQETPINARFADMVTDSIRYDC